MSNWSVNSDLINGNNMFLYLVDLNGGAMSNPSAMTSGQTKVVAYAQSCSLEINADTLDVTSKLSCRWNAVMPGNGSYTVNSDSLYCKQSAASANNAYTIDDLYEQMVDGENIGWIMALDKSYFDDNAQCGEIQGPYTGSAATYYYGEAAITSLSITAGNNEICSSSISLTGSGKPEKGGGAA